MGLKEGLRSAFKSPAHVHNPTVPWPRGAPGQSGGPHTRAHASGRPPPSGAASQLPPRRGRHHPHCPRGGCCCAVEGDHVYDDPCHDRDRRADVVLRADEGVHHLKNCHGRQYPSARRRFVGCRSQYGNGNHGEIARVRGEGQGEGLVGSGVVCQGPAALVKADSFVMQFLGTDGNRVCQISTLLTVGGYQTVW